jgi:hypothetical protein
MYSIAEIGSIEQWDYFLKTKTSDDTDYQRVIRILAERGCLEMIKWIYGKRHIKSHHGMDIAAKFNFRIKTLKI